MKFPAVILLGLTFAVLSPFLLIFPLIVLLSEIRLYRIMHSAAKKISSLGLRPEPVLLRLSDAEIRTLAKGKLPSCLADSSSLRFRLFFSRFAGN